MAGIAADMRPGKILVFAQEMNEQGARVGGRFDLLPV